MGESTNLYVASGLQRIFPSCYLGSFKFQKARRAKVQALDREVAQRSRGI